MRAGNVKFASMPAGKQLKFHKKWCILIFGRDNFKERTRFEIQEEPVMLGKSVIAEKQEEKYLGDILSREGLQNLYSVQSRIEKDK